MAGRILVIDDAVEVVDFFRSLLGQFGHEVIAAHDGESGLRKFYDELPDLVFLDLLLPRRDGSDVCAEIKRSEHGLITPVAIITGVYKNQSKVEAMRQHGAVDYLVKPVPVAKITALVDWALGDKPEEETTPDEDLELLRLQPPAGDDTTAPIASGILPGLLARAEQERASGVLFATRGKTRKALLIQDGSIVGARSNAPVDRIDRVLLAMRKVTPLQMSALRSAAQVKGDALAAAVLLNFIDQTEAHDARRFQAITTGLSLFRWGDGAVRFVPGETLECPRLDRPIDPARLALIGLRKNPALRQALSRLQLADEMVILRPDERACALRDSDLARREREVFDLVDGRRSVFRLRQVSVLAQLPVDDVLSVLVGAGVLKVAKDAPTDRAGDALATASGSHRTGSLESVTFAELLGTLARERANGVLVVEGRFRRRFVFQAGDVVHGRSSDPADMLGEILIQQGMVSKAILEEALQTQRDHRPDRRIGSLLFEMGALSLSKLEEGTRAQLLRVVESTFAWTEGVYSFEPAPSVAEPSVSLGMELLVLLRRGIGTMRPEWLERRWCRGADEICLVAQGSAGSRDDLARDEREILALAAEGASIERMVADRGREALLAIELLVAAGLAVTEARPRAAATATLDVAAITTPVSVGLDEQDEEDDPNQLSVVTLEADDPASPRVATDAAAAAPLLAFLRDEVLAERREAEREIRRLSEEVGRLGERVRGLELDKAALEASRRELEALSQAPAADHRALEENNREAKESNRALAADRSALEAKVDKLEAGRRALEEKHGKLQAEKGAIEARSDKLEADRRALEEKTAKLRTEKAALESKNGKLVADARALEESNRKLQAERDAIEAKNGKVDSGNRALEESNRKLQTEKGVLEGKNGKLVAEREAIEARSSKLESESRALEESNRKLQTEKGVLEGKNGKLESDNRALEESNRRLQAECGALAAKNHEIQSDKAALEARIDKLEADKLTLEQRHRALESNDHRPDASDVAVVTVVPALVRPPAPPAEPTARGRRAGAKPGVPAAPGRDDADRQAAAEATASTPESPARKAAAAATAKPAKARAGGAGKAKGKGGAADRVKGRKPAETERELVPV